MKNKLKLLVILILAVTFIGGCSSDKTNQLTAIEVAKLMGNGTNLGNTMEAFGRTTIGTDAAASDYETIWGQPVTTPEMIQGMKDAGFDSIRIPVAWTNTMNFEDGDYTINQAYLDRVEEIVNYALDADMYVIVNDHWDGGWWGMFGSASEETRAQAMELYTEMWTQVGERFKDYPYTVILESANEELGNRLNDVDVAADSGTLSEDECYELNTITNQAFVDTIRAQGGKNADRFLLVAGYNTDIYKTCDERFQMPTDTVDDKLLLSIHYYTPWSYCGTTGDVTWGTEKNYNEMNESLEKLTKFTEEGYGIVFGEYAALTKADGSLKNNTLEYTKNFLDNCDLYGYVPMLWDTNAFFLRNELKMIDDDLASLFLNRNFDAQSSLSDEEIKEQALSSMDDALAQAIENDIIAAENGGPVLSGDEDAIAWIMFSSSDWGITYSVGDMYDPTSTTAGLVATDVEIEEAGTYTVSLDFTGTAEGFANSCQFSALGISNGELLFPGYLIEIEEIRINNEVYEFTGIPYTTSDDEICTRLNLYNEWVNEVPEEARTANEKMRPALSPTILDPLELDAIQTISVTFNYSPSE